MEKNGKKWKLVVGEEWETCQSTMDVHDDGELVWLPNWTLQICTIHGDSPVVYEVVLDDCETYWLRQVAEKPWATCGLLKALASAARRICSMTKKLEWMIGQQWTDTHVADCCDFIENRNS